MLLLIFLNFKVKERQTKRLLADTLGSRAGSSPVCPEEQVLRFQMSSYLYVIIPFIIKVKQRDVAFQIVIPRKWCTNSVTQGYIRS